LKRNHLLIDFENVQPRGLASLEPQAFKVTVFLGPQQTKLPVELVKALQALGKDAVYVQVPEKGKNALDFHIAFVLGESCNREPDVAYHILSRDTGFDPLIRYLNGRGIDVRRCKEIADIPLLRVNGASPVDRIDAIVRNLKSRGTGRPRKVRTLKNTINSLFGKSLDDSQLAEIVRNLAERRVIGIEGENVSYRLSD
jgi:hypothetical protein